MNHDTTALELEFKKAQQRITVLETTLAMLILATEKGAPYTPSLQGKVNKAKLILNANN